MTWRGEEVAWHGEKKQIRRRHIARYYRMCFKCTMEKKNKKNSGRQVEASTLY
jgi:hypothetical protein